MFPFAEGAPEGRCTIQDPLINSTQFLVIAFLFVCFLTSSYGGNRGRSGLQCGRGNLPLDLCHSPDLALTHLAPQQILFTLRWTASNIQNFPPCANRRHKVAHSRSGHDGIKITIAFLHATINPNPPQTNCNCLLVNKNPHKGQ